MNSRKTLCLLLFFFISFVLFAGSISYGDVGIPEVRKPEAAPTPIPKPEVWKAPQAPKATYDSSYANLLNRIEALESRSGGNVTAPKIRGLKIGFEIRHRFEERTRAANISTGSSRTSGAVVGARNAFLLSPVTPLVGTTPGTPGTVHQGAAKRGIREDNEFILQRVRIYLDADLNKNVRGYVKLQDSRTFGAEQSTTGNLSRVDLLEGYVDLRNLGDLSPMLENINVRVGRWQWFYGNHRLIGTLNWANQSRSYDGARVRWDNKKGDWIDLFAAKIQEDFTGGVSGDGTSISALSDRDEVFYGLYTHFKHDNWGLVSEPYFIARSRSRDTNDTGYRDGEQRYTFGARIHGKNMSWLPGVDFTFEHAWQAGKFEPAPGSVLRDFAGTSAFAPGVPRPNSSQVIQAYAGALGAGYTFENVAWKPRIGYDYVYATGDKRPGSGASKTFSQLYPTGHARLGYIDFHAWQNIRDHQFHLTLKPSKKLLVKADLHFFRADQVADNWYNVGGGVTRVGGTGIGTLGPGGGLSGSSIRGVDPDYGQEIDLTVKYKLFKNFGVVGGYSHYFVDDFIEDTNNGLDRGTDWVYLQTTLKF